MISIIIPTYNEEKMIAKTLAQLQSLTVPHEVIVSDDQSTDRTVEIAKKFDAHVLVTEIKHKSIAQNRNTGAKIAKGDILVFLDAQSTLQSPEEFFRSSLKHLSSDPRIVAVTCALRVLPEIETMADKCVYSLVNVVTRLKNNVLGIGEASGKFQMIRRSAFEKAGGFREDLVTREDADMFHRLAKIGKTYYDPKLKVFHYERRAHRIGWPKLLWIWMSESFYFYLFNRNIATEWKEIR